MRRVLVTGANKGIGLAIATAILEGHDDTFVFIGSRSAARGEAAKQQLVTMHPAWTERIAVVELDVASDASVSRLTKQIRERCPGEPTPLYALVNNAGVGHGTLASVLAVNTLGMRRVSEACLPLLDPERGRIVNITSASGPNFVATCSDEWKGFFTNPGVEWAELQALIDQSIPIDGDTAEFGRRGLGKGDPYGFSKACANSYTMLLARRHPNLRVNACTPGFIETDLTRGYATSSGKTPSELGMRPPADGARTPTHLLFADLEGNGRYYGSDGKRSPLDRYRAPGAAAYEGD